MAELKKCPFCGGEVKIIAEQVDARTMEYQFICSNLDCHSNTYFDYCDREEAIEAWNNRATEAEIRVSAIDDAMEKLAEEICTGGGCLKDRKCTYKGSNCRVSKIMLKKTMAVLEQLKGE